MKILKVTILIVLTTIITSCSTPKERKVNAKDVEFSGLANKYLKIVDGEYKFTNNGDDAFITVKFKLKTKPTEKVCIDYHYGGLRINAVGETGQIFDTGVYGFKTSKKDNSKIIDLLNNGKKGDKKSISFTWDYYGVSEETGIPIFKNATTFEVIDDKTFNLCSKLKKEESETASSSNTNSNTNNTKKEDADFDKALDSYEEYVTQYIKLMKKVKNGDNSAISEYPKMLEKANNFSEKLEKAGDNLSTSQMTRFLKIQEKLVSAI